MGVFQQARISKMERRRRRVENKEKEGGGGEWRLYEDDGGFLKALIIVPYYSRKLSSLGMTLQLSLVSSARGPSD